MAHHRPKEIDFNSVEPEKSYLSNDTNWIDLSDMAWRFLEYCKYCGFWVCDEGYSKDEEYYKLEGAASKDSRLRVIDTYSQIADEQKYLKTRAAASEIATIFWDDKTRDVETLRKLDYNYQVLNKCSPGKGESDEAIKATGDWADYWGGDVFMWLMVETEKAKQEAARLQQKHHEIPQTCVQLVKRIRYCLLHFQSRHVQAFNETFHPWNVMDVAVILGHNIGWDLYRKFDKVIVECDELYAKYSNLDLTRSNTPEKDEDYIMGKIWETIFGLDPKKEDHYVRRTRFSSHPEIILDGYKQALAAGQIQDQDAANFLGEIGEGITKRNVARTGEMMPQHIGRKLREFQDYIRRSG